MGQEFDNNDLNVLVPSIRKNFQLLEGDNESPTGFKCMHCGEIIPKRILEVASHDSYCAGKQNHDKIRDLEIKYNNNEITIGELNAAAKQIFEIEDDDVVLYSVHSPFKLDVELSSVHSLFKL